MIVNITNERIAQVLEGSKDFLAKTSADELSKVDSKTTYMCIAVKRWMRIQGKLGKGSAQAIYETEEVCRQIRERIYGNFTFESYFENEHREKNAEYLELEYYRRIEAIQRERFKFLNKWIKELKDGQ